jgi:hypothetical protein
LHSYATPAHEWRAGKILHSPLLDALVSLSRVELSDGSAPPRRLGARGMTQALEAAWMGLSPTGPTVIVP